MWTVKRIVACSVAGLLGLVVLIGGWFTVEQGERTAVLRAGSLHYVADPGFHLKIPLIDSTHSMEVRTQKMVFDGLASYSRDIQQSKSRITVNYELPAPNVAAVYTQYGTGYADRVVKPAVYDKYKEIFGRYTAAEIVFERARIGDEVFKSIAAEVKPYGVLVSAVQIENIDFTDEFEKAIEDAVKAKTEVTRAEQVLLRREIEAKTVVVQAKANAEAAREKAAGEADALRLTSTAEAEAIQKRGDALSKNPRLVELSAVEKWDGKVPVTMVPGSAVPFIGVK